ncbi:hypothetical protein [Algoriphagus winogradskyi]|uniref:Uncharacterized protein n=1 Tax=Algoriphagus winogradskyi TaxID=237017 RepID=A0ABY1NCE1_9BACT|nr:hypothetical protein [Algoriphagus winogradskyi]SMP04324.1 hypothetical protein SAMN06265367_101260 [Algoriphagus winogradskyi]
MKNLFLYILLSVASIIPALSQVTNPKKYDFKLTLPSYDNLQRLEVLKDTVFFEGSTQNKKFESFEGFPGYIDKNNKLLYSQDENIVVINPAPFYSLRIITPSGNYPIQIYKPDSTKNYTLLIKDF